MTRKSGPAAASASVMPPTELWSVIARPWRPMRLARATRSAGATRESGEYRVWLWRSRSMKEGRKPDGSLKALGPGIPARPLSDRGDMRPSVVVEARVGLLHHRVLVDGASSAVWRGRGGGRPAGGCPGGP